MSPAEAPVARAKKKAATKTPTAEHLFTPAAPLSAESQSNTVKSEDAILTYRTRLQLVGDLLNSAMAELGKRRAKDPVGRGLYLRMLGAVFEALDGMAQGLPLDDLLKLSRVVAEQRRAESLMTRSAAKPKAFRTKAAQAKQDAAHPTGTLPPQFAQIVERIYGANLADDVNAKPETEQPAA
jgi:hypothetical protein